MMGNNRDILNYKVFLLDIWGVIYDGFHIYEGVIETLNKLKELNKKVIFFSNVPRRKLTIKGMLEKFAITPDLYHDIVTSGEFSRHELENKTNDFGDSYYYIGAKTAEEVVLDLKSYKKTDGPKNADFAILTSTLNFYEEAMSAVKELVDYKIPLICVNPDKSFVDKNGNLSLCPGSIADVYEKSGGKVFYFGKPYKGIYDFALNGVSKSDVVAVGDSINNDILGANNYGIDSVFVSSGIHRNELEINIGQKAEEDRLKELFKKHSVKPTYVVSLLKNIIE